MRKVRLVLALVFAFFFLISTAWALPWDNATIPEDISEQGHTWFINYSYGLYDYDFNGDDEVLHFVKSNDLSLIISESYDKGETALYDDFSFYTGSSDVLYGDSNVLNIITQDSSIALPLSYDNLTDLSGTFNVTFYGGASLSAQGLEAKNSGDVTMNVSIPSARGFYTVDTVSLGGSAWPQVNPWVDCLYESLFNKALIARVLDQPYYEVRYSNYGGAIPYGYPASVYPLIRRDLTPSRFSDDEDLDIDLGTVFVNKYHSWPSYTEVPGSYEPSESLWREDRSGKGRSLMVKVTNWGDEQQVTDIHPLNTGFEAFNLRMKKIDCDTDWPAWGWYHYLVSGEGWASGNFEDFDWGEPGAEAYQWPLPPAYSVMYWGGRFGNDTVSGDVPYNRDYQEGENSFYVEVGDNIFTFTWTPKEFETLGSIYPSPDEDNVDFLASYAWTAGSSVPVPDTPETYQGSGVVMHLVSFDIPSTDLGGMNAFLPAYDFEDPSADIVSLEQMPTEDSIAGNLTYAAIVDVPFYPFPYGSAIPLSLTGSEIELLESDDLAVMPLHAFAFLTEDLMKDVDEEAYNEFVQALEEDTPLDIAFLENFRLFNYDAEGYKTDLIQLVESEGKEPSNYFRVVGNKYRVCVHFFAVLADTDEAGVDVKDGYFLMSDGTQDNSFNSAFAGTVAPAVATTDSGGGGCSALGIVPGAAILLLPLLMLLKK